MEGRTIFVALAQMLFSVLGACAKWLELKDKEQQKRLVSEAVGALFSGGLVFCLYQWLNLNVYLALAFAGLSGWLGANSVTFIGKIITEHSGIKGITNIVKNEDEKESEGK